MKMTFLRMCAFFGAVGFAGNPAIAQTCSVVQQDPPSAAGPNLEFVSHSGSAVITGFAPLTTPDTGKRYLKYKKSGSMQISLWGGAGCPDPQYPINYSGAGAWEGQNVSGNGTLTLASKDPVTHKLKYRAAASPDDGGNRVRIVVSGPSTNLLLSNGDECNLDEGVVYGAFLIFDHPFFLGFTSGAVDPKAFNPLYIPQIRDQWNYAGTIDPVTNTLTEEKNSERFSGLGSSPLGSGGQGDGGAWGGFTQSPANAYSIYLDAGSVTEATPTSKKYSATNACTNYTDGSVKMSGSVTESLETEDTPDAALQRAKGIADSADTPTGTSNTAFDDSIPDALLRVETQWVHYKAKFRVPCPGNYQAVVFAKVSEHGVLPTGPEQEVDSKPMNNLQSGEQVLENDFHALEPNKDYAITRVELRNPSCTNPEAAHGGGGLHSVKWQMDLGAGPTGAAAGYISLRSESITPALYTPAALAPVVGTGGVVTIVRASDGALRQMLAPQAIADVVALDASSYEVRFYYSGQVGVQDPATKVYPVSGTPYAVFKFENPDAAQNLSERLRITETRGASVRVAEYGYNAATGWSFSQGNGLSRETLVISSASADIVRTSTLRAADNTMVSKTQKTYRTFTWGEELIAEVKDPDGAALATSYSFYADSAADGAAYGRLKQQTNADGSWIRYTYDTSGREAKSIRPYLGSVPTDAENLCRVTEKTYVALADADGDGKTELLTTSVEYTLGTETGRSHRVEWSKPVALEGGSFKHQSDIRCTVAGAGWNASTNLTTDTLTYSSGAFAGLTRRVINPDGTVVLTARTLDTNGQQTVITKAGAANGTQDDVVDGTRTVAITNRQGRLAGETATDIATNLVVSSWTATLFDALGRPTRLDYSDGTYETRDYACCGLASSRDRTGLVTTYQYDSLGRQTHVTRAGLTMRTDYDAAGQVKAVTRIGSDNSEMVQSTSVYDLAGRLIERRDALSRLTSYGESYNSTTGVTTRTTTNPSGAIVETSARDGSRLSVSGSAAAPRNYEYSFDAGALSTKEILVGDANATTEWSRTVVDFLGNVKKTVYPDGATFTNHYDAFGRLDREADPGGVTTLYSYNTKGEREIAAVDRNANNAIDYGDGSIAGDRIVRTQTTIAARDGFTVQRTTQQTWETDNDATPTTVGISEQSVDGLRTWQTDRGLTTTSVMVLDGSGGRTVTTTTPDGVKTIQVYANDRLISTTVKTAADTQLLASTYAYDFHGRLQSTTDSRTGTTNYSYYSDDQVQSVTTPDPDATRSGPGYDPQVASYTYDTAGRVSTVTQPDGGVVNTTYWPTGAVKRTWGSRTYPSEYTYDLQGRVKTLTTWQDFAGSTGAAITTWNYDTQRGWLANKRYNDNTGPNYSYRLSGRLDTRTSARGIVTTYNYDNTGAMFSVSYSDGTPSVTMGFDRSGRLKTRADASGASTLTYASSGQLQDEDYSSGALNQLGVHRTYDSLARLGGVSAVSAVGGALNAVTYSYDAASRLDTVTQGGNTAQYGYLANSPLVQSVTFRQGAATRLTTTKAYDNLNRLASISSAPATGSAISYTYDYNSANQRTRVTREDSARWDYGYDALGQVNSAVKKRPSGMPFAGLEYAYTYDDIGNRKTATTNAQTATYSPNLLNQYSQRTVPGAVDVFGDATASSTVTVAVGTGTPQTTTRQGDWYFRQVTTDNSTVAQNLLLKITGVKNLAGAAGEDAVAEVTRTAFVAKTPEAFVYDADGDLTDDARWHYTWDGENRLVAMETPIGAISAGVIRKKLEFGYDGQGRRFSKKVYDWSGSAWTLVNSTRFLYDGWNLIAELNGLTGNSVVRSYGWGMDLSGSAEGAGGVGGLLFAATSTSSYATAYDGNGNIVGYADLGSGMTVAMYDYSVFGETLVVGGIASETIPIRFSTKYSDAESDLLYYGLRYYRPSGGRWLSRDPIEERGGVNLYGFLQNDGINAVDPLGLLDGATVPYSPATMLQPPTLNVSGSLSRDQLGETIRRLLTPNMARGFKATTLLAAWPGGSMEMDIVFDGAVTKCCCADEAGHERFQFVGEASITIRGGFGYILGNSDYEVKNPANRPSHNNVHDTSKPGSGPIRGIDGRLNNPTLGGWKNSFSSKEIKGCEDDFAISGEVGAQVTAGAALVSFKGVVPFAVIDRDGMRWSFQYTGSVSYGKSPVGLRADLYGKAKAVLKISFP